MKKHTFIVAIFMITFLIAGCASTRVSSFRDPAFAGKTYQRILIIAPFADVESRTTAEQAISVSLAKYAAKGIPSLGVLMPTRTYSEDELLVLLNDNRIDGVLVLTLTDAYTKEAYIPQSSYTYGRATLSGYTATYSSRTHHYGGYYISKPRVKFEMRLYDVLTGKTAWVASSLTRGNAFAKFDTLIDSLAETTSEKLKEDGLLQ